MSDSNNHINPLRVLITGASGQLGRELVNAFSQTEAHIVAADHSRLDITDEDAVRRFLAEGDFTHIINCAAYTAVDKAESEPQKCFSINIDGVANLVRGALEHGIRLVHISSDYVFAGTAHTPYTEDSPIGPLGVYGRAKLGGEGVITMYEADAMIIRTGWLYSPHGNNFVKTILRKASEGKALRVVGDQTGTPTYAAHLAEAIVDILTNHAWQPGIYHYSNAGETTWYEFAAEILRMTASDVSLTECTTAEYPTPAKRPPYSVLDKTKIINTFNIVIPHWTEGLKECLAAMGYNNF